MKAWVIDKENKFKSHKILTDIKTSGLSGDSGAHYRHRCGARGCEQSGRDLTGGLHCLILNRSDVFKARRRNVPTLRRLLSTTIFASVRRTRTISVFRSRPVFAVALFAIAICVAICVAIWITIWIAIWVAIILTIRLSITSCTRPLSRSRTMSSRSRLSVCVSAVAIAGLMFSIVNVN